MNNIEFKSVKPQGLCCICEKPLSEIRIWIDGGDLIVKAHARCLINRMNQNERNSMIERVFRQRKIVEL